MFIPHFIFQQLSRLLRWYSGFDRTPPDGVVTWKGFFLLHQEKIALMKDQTMWQKLQDKFSLGVVMCDMKHPISVHKIEQIIIG